MSVHQLHTEPGPVPKALQKALDKLLTVTSSISTEYGAHAPLADFHDAAAVVHDLIAQAEAYDLDAARLAAEARELDQRAKVEADAYGLEKARRLARRRADEDEAEGDERLMAAVVPLRLCDIPDVQVPYRVEGLLISGALSLVWAAAKTGKTTMLVNLLRCLTVPGVPFLGTYLVAPVEEGRTVGLLSYEMDAAQLRNWCDQHGVDGARVRVWDLRGRPNPLRSQAGRDLLVKEMTTAGVEFLMVDTFSRASAGTDENDAAAITAWLAMLGEVTAEAGVTDVMLLHHTGWGGDRLRGSTALAGYPDVLLGLNRDDNGVRYLQAEGRFNGSDEALAPTALQFDPSTKTLTLTGVSKAAAKAHAQAEEKAAKELADHLLLQSQAEALADVLSTEPISQAKAFSLLKDQHGLKVHRSRHADVVAYAIEHHGVQVGGAGGPGSGASKRLSRSAQ